MYKFPAHGTCSLQPIPVEGLNVCDIIYISPSVDLRIEEWIQYPVIKHGNGRSIKKNSDKPPFVGHVELLCSIAGG
jgi:hypothetical protein